MTRSERIAVIGAGPSGLAGAKNLLDAGFHDLVVFDRGHDVGGNWVFDAASGHSSVFETTHIISSRRFSQYHDFPMPEHYPDYPSHEQLYAYFRAYAEHFRLRPFLRLHTTVTAATPAEQGGWDLTSVTEGQPPRTEHFDRLVVANGHHWKPRWPAYPGSFDGPFLHSHDYKRAAPFAGQRVLVIGGGNSAADIAVETGRVSERTGISMRRGYWIVPKFLLGHPSDVLHDLAHRWLGWVPTPLRLRGLSWLLRLLVGPPERYGLQTPDHTLGETHPTLNSELLYHLRHGTVHPHPDVARLDGHTVHFVDGTSERYDVIVAATGYQIAHPFFDPSLVDYSEGPVPLYLKMIHPTRDDLVFLGLFQPFGCIWPLSELQAKIVARWWTGRWQPPADRPAAIAHELAHPHVQQLDTPRHTITVDYPTFHDALTAELPATFRSTQPVVPEPVSA